MEIQEECYSINEICRNFKTSQTTVYKMIRDKQIQAYKPERCRKIPKREFQQIVYEHY